MKNLLLLVTTLWGIISHAYKECGFEEKINNTSVEYDETGCLYTSYEGLVMTGYQGWFNAEGDGMNRGWNHYCATNRLFEPGRCTIDYWPDISEYEKVFPTKFKFKDNSTAYVFSSYDYSTIDLHFKWMKEYGIDGIFLQRFLTNISNKNNHAGKNHADKVLENVIKASKKYERAICLMYDLSGAKPSDFTTLVKDWNLLIEKYDLFNNKENPTYLRHNKKPLLAIWGVGFSDHSRAYNIKDVQNLINELKGFNDKISIMIGVPYYWRTLRKDAVHDTQLHELIKESDIIMDWGVGRYNYNNFEERVINDKKLDEDIKWCKENGVLFVPHTFPGGSAGNLHNDINDYDKTPRYKGNFFWKQVSTAINYGAKALYIGMFDEIDEGTQIFKCLRNSEVPINKPEEDKKFVGHDDDLPSDHYLWLAGQAANWIHGENGYTETMPTRTNYK